MGTNKPSYIKKSIIDMHVKLRMYVCDGYGSSINISKTHA